MAERKLTTLELAGSTVAIIVIAMFFYLKTFYDPVSRRYNRIQEDWAKISTEVKHLREISAGGRIERDLRRINTRLKKKEEELGKAESILAKDAEADRLSMEIIQKASEYGLWVKDYKPITGEKLKEIVKDKKNPYERRFYNLVLYGKFSNVTAFLEKIGSFPKLVIVEKIDMEKTGQDEPLKTTLLLSI